MDEARAEGRPRLHQVDPSQPARVHPAQQLAVHKRVRLIEGADPRALTTTRKARCPRSYWRQKLSLSFSPQPALTTGLDTDVQNEAGQPCCRWGTRYGGKDNCTLQENP